MGRLFGTDGVRGVAGVDLTEELAAALGCAAAQVLAAENGKKPLVLIGRDTRESGCVLEAAAARGLTQAGADVLLTGVVPTPAIAYLVTKRGADAGVMISASHNPYEYNGIKLFGPDGCKLTDEEEDRIEAVVRSGEFSPAAQAGSVNEDKNAVSDYIEHLAASYRGGFSGKILADCANGSAVATAKRLFERIGVSADVICCEPDGKNINENCGSTHAGALCARVAAGGYDAGFSFDGDFLLAVFAEYLKKQGRLAADTVVVTNMSNMGFFKRMEQLGLHTAVTKVGDRYVLEEMRRGGYVLGGEQSGHMILLDRASTGDGQLSAVTLLDAMAVSKKSLSELAGAMRRYPQVMHNLSATPQMKEKLETPGAKQAVAESEERLGGRGRVVVRASGTEPLIRVMIEGEDAGMIAREAETLSAALLAALG